MNTFIVDEARERTAFEAAAYGHFGHVGWSDEGEPLLLHLEKENGRLSYMWRGWLAAKQDAINTLCNVMLKHGLHTGHGDSLGSVLSELDGQLAERRDALPRWIAVESAKDLPVGVWLVYLESEMVGSRIHPARVHPNITNIGSCFAWDAPRVIAYAPPPSPPGETPCPYCDGQKQIETDNNGPIVDCPVCEGKGVRP